MIISRIRRRIQEVPDFIIGYKFMYGLRLLFKRYFPVPTLIRTKAGSIIFLGLDKIDDIIVRHLNDTHKDIYFSQDLQLLTGDIVLDVGAHHGIFAVELVSRFPDIRVYCFEPDTTSYRYLQFNRYLNSAKCIKPINAGLAPSTGKAFIIKSDEGSWGNYIANNKSEGKHPIQTISVQDFVFTHSINKVSFLKLNAEGAEYFILPGLFQLKIFPTKILLFGHPEMGILAELIKLIENNNYVISYRNNNESRPCFIFNFLK